MSGSEEFMTPLHRAMFATRTSLAHTIFESLYIKRQQQDVTLHGFRHKSSCDLAPTQLRAAMKEEQDNPPSVVHPLEY